MKVLHLLLFALVALILVQFAVAATEAKPATLDAKAKEATAPNKETPKAPKDTPKEPTSKHAAKEPAKEPVKEAVKPVKEAAKEAKKAAEDTVKEAKKTAEDTFKEAKKGVEETIKEAKKGVEETVKEVKKEVPKESKKDIPNKDAPRFPKEEPKADASFLDVYLPLAQEYAEKAYQQSLIYGQEAIKYSEVAWKEAKKYGTAGAILAQEYSVTLANAVADYKTLLEEYTYKQSLEIVDKFLDPQHARIVKKNYLNWYGVAIIFADIFVIFLIVKHLRWVFSLTALRLFFSAVNLGVYTTLATITILTSEEPTKGINASVRANLHLGLFYASIVSTVLNVMALVVFPGRVKSFIVALLSVGLFVDALELRAPLESAVGSIPAYSLEALTFLVQAIFVFDSISITTATARTYTLKSSSSSSAVPGFIKEESIKKEKAKKSSKVVSTK